MDMTIDMTDSTTNPKTAPEIQAWLIDRLASLLELEATAIDINRSFYDYGLNSSTAIHLTGELEDWLGDEVEPTLLYEYSTIKAIADYLG